MKKANLTLRHSFYSYKEDLNIFEIAKDLPKKNLIGVYQLGEKARNKKFINKEHAIDYVFKYQQISTIEEICDEFFTLWNPYKNIVKGFESIGVQSILLFEFIIQDFEFPSSCFESNFLLFLSEMGIELKFYFYEAP